MEYATLQQNIPEVSNGHLRRPYSLFKLQIGGRKARRSEIAMLGAVYSYSCVHGKPEARCNFSYTQFGEKLHLSRATVARSVKALRDGKLVEQDKSRRIGAAYRYIEPPQEKGYIDTEIFLYTTPFTVRGEAEPVYLTHSMIDVLCLIWTHVANPKGKGYFEGSVRSIARTLGLSHTTVQSALNTLYRAELVFRTEGGRGVNLHKRSRFVVNSKLLRIARKKYRKNTAAENAPRQEVNAAEKRAERERFYVDRQAEAQARVDRHLGTLMKDKEYAQIDRDLRALGPKIALAELNDPKALTVLEKQKQALNVQRARRMALLGIDEIDLQPIYICRKCSDTGYTKDGRMCDCYRPPRRARQ